MGEKTEKTLRPHHDRLLEPTTFKAVFDDVVGATESDHLPIICVTNHPRLSSRNKGPMRLDASRVSRGYRLLRSPVAWAECGDFAYATDVARNEYAGKLDRGLMWCVDTDTLAKHMAETATNTANLGEPTIGDRRLLEPHELNDLRAARPEDQ